MAVYFIRKAGDRDGPVKIGFTRDLANRVRALSTATPGGVDVLAVVPSGGKELEAHLHQRFSHRRISGEWFQSDDELVSLMRSIGRSGDSAIDQYLLEDEEEHEVGANTGVAIAADRLSYVITHKASFGLSTDQAIDFVASETRMTAYAVKHIVTRRAKSVTADKFAEIERAYLATLHRQKAEIDDRIEQATATLMVTDELNIFDELEALAQKVRLARERIG